MIGIAMLRKPRGQFFDMTHSIRIWQTNSAVTAICPHNNLIPQRTEANIPRLLHQHLSTLLQNHAELGRQLGQFCMAQIVVKHTHIRITIWRDKDLGRGIQVRIHIHQPRQNQGINQGGVINHRHPAQLQICAIGQFDNAVPKLIRQVCNFFQLRARHPSKGGFDAHDISIARLHWAQ